MARTETYDDTVKPRRGISLAKGPVLIVGIASLVFGVLGFIFANHSFTFDVPDGTVNGSTFLGIEGNGWTWTLFAAAGLLLMLGSPIHWGAKSMAFIVGVAIVTAGEFVQRDDVAPQPETERAAEDRHRLERRSADPVVIERDLVVAGEIQRLEHAPDIGSPDFRGGIAGAVGQQNDFSAHEMPRHSLKRNTT